LEIFTHNLAYNIISYPNQGKTHHYVTHKELLPIIPPMYKYDFEDGKLTTPR